MSDDSPIRNDIDFKNCVEATDDYYRILIDLNVVEQMIKVAAKQIHHLGYKSARDSALDTYKFEGRTADERDAYKDFIDRYFNRKAVKATKLKHRPRTPMSTYEP